MSNLNKYLEVIKLDYSMSGKQLAEAMGVTSRQITNYVNGLSSIPMKNVERLAEYLNMSVAKLIEEADRYYQDRQELTQKKLSKSAEVNEPGTEYSRAKGSVTITLDLANQVHMRMLKEYLQMNGAQVLA